MDTERDANVVAEMKRQTKVIEDVRSLLVLWSIIAALGMVIWIVSTVQA